MIDIEIHIIRSTLLFALHNFLQNGNVPVIDFARFSIAFESNGNLFSVRWQHRIWIVYAIVMWIGWQFDDEHVGIVSSSVVPGFYCQSFAMVGVGTANLLQAQFG